MNREQVAKAFFGVFDFADWARSTEIFSQDEYSDLEFKLRLAYQTAVMSCIPYSLRDVQRADEIVTFRDFSQAYRFSRDWIERMLCLYSPREVHPVKAADAIFQFLRENNTVRSTSALAEIVASKYCVMIGIDSRSIAYFYIESIIREAFGLPGDPEVQKEQHRDQFLKAEEIRFLAIKGSVSPKMPYILGGPNDFTRTAA